MASLLQNPNGATATTMEQQCLDDKTFSFSQDDPILEDALHLLWESQEASGAPLPTTETEPPEIKIPPVLVEHPIFDPANFLWVHDSTSPVVHHHDDNNDDTHDEADKRSSSHNNDSICDNLDAVTTDSDLFHTDSDMNSFPGSDDNTEELSSCSSFSSKHHQDSDALSVAVPVLQDRENPSSSIIPPSTPVGTPLESFPPASTITPVSSRPSSPNRSLSQSSFSSSSSSSPDVVALHKHIDFYNMPSPPITTTKTVTVEDDDQNAAFFSTPPPAKKPNALRSSGDCSHQEKKTTKKKKNNNKYPSKPPLSTTEPVVIVHTVGDNDIVFGRGGKSIHHIGNVRFRDLVMQHLEEYRYSTKTQKTAIAKRLVRHITQDVGGRFLLQNKEQGEWTVVPFHRARTKTSQRFREALSKKGWGQVSPSTTKHTEQEGEDDDDEECLQVEEVELC